VAAFDLRDLVFVVRGVRRTWTVVRTAAQGSSDPAFPIDLSNREANGTRQGLRTLSRLNAHAIHLSYCAVRRSGCHSAKIGAASPAPDHIHPGSNQCPVSTCITACSPDRAAVKLRVLAFTKGEMGDPPGARRLVPTVESSPATATSWSM
jgi:hypothetical protein